MVDQRRDEQMQGIAEQLRRMTAAADDREDYVLAALLSGALDHVERMLTTGSDRP